MHVYIYIYIFIYLFINTYVSICTGVLCINIHMCRYVQLYVSHNASDNTIYSESIAKRNKASGMWGSHWGWQVTWIQNQQGNRWLGPLIMLYVSHNASDNTIYSESIAKRNKASGMWGSHWGWQVTWIQNQQGNRWLGPLIMLKELDGCS